VTKKYVQFAGFSDTFTGSGTSWTSDRAEGATLTGLWLYTARDGTKITFLDTVGEKAFNCPGADPKTCRIPTSITRPDGLKFTLGWELKTVCINQPGEPCAREFNYWRLKTVTSSAGYSLAITYQSNAAGANMPPDAPWYTRTSVTFNNSANPPSPVPTITYARPDASTLNVTDPAGRTWRFTVDASKRIIGVRRPGSNSDHLSYAYNAGGTISSATRDAVTNSYTRSVSGTTATETATNPLSQQTVVITDTTKGRPTSVTDGLNRTTSFQYEANGRLTRSTLPEGNYVQLTYDARGNVTETRAVAKAGSGLADIVTSASFDTTCTNVVTCNKPNSTTDARSNTTTTPTTARTAAC
jgi:YD repeat-containing protein